MIQFRPFRNDDPPALAAIWNAQPPSGGLLHRVSSAMLDELVFSKLYFDRAGFIVAERDGEPVGFAHAAWGPNEQRTGPDCTRGILCLLLTTPIAQSAEIAAALVERAEHYLWERGARQITAGGTAAAHPFYLGLNGGSNLPGVLVSQGAWIKILRGAGYIETGAVTVYQKALDTFRPVVDRNTMQWRRQYRIETREYPPFRDWWEAAVWGESQRTQYSLRAGTPSPSDGLAVFWDVEPLASAWGRSVRGLYEFTPPTSPPVEELTAFFLGDVFRLMKAQGVGLIEAQVAADDAPLEKSLQKLEFKEVDRGLLLTKRLDG